MAFFEEFKKFALRGNVVDLAVGVIIGAAFGKITTSFVNDIVMPPLGLLIGGMDFSDLSLVLKPATEGAEAVTLNYGAFIQTCFDFTIMAFAIFLAIKLMNSLHAKKEEAPPKPAELSGEEKLLTEIRDLLKAK